MPAPRCSCFCRLSAVAPARVGRHASFVWHVGAWQHKCVCAAVATRHGDGTCAPAPTGTRLTRDHARAIHALDSPPGEAHRQSTCSHTHAPYCICSDVQHQPARIERDDRERDESEDDHRTDEQKRERDGGRGKTGRREERGQGERHVYSGNDGWHGNGGERVRASQARRPDSPYTPHGLDALGHCLDRPRPPPVSAHVPTYHPGHMRTSFTLRPSCRDHVHI